MSVDCAALARALRDMCGRFDGLRRCPDCGANLEERVDHAVGCPVGVALSTLLNPQTEVYAKWISALEDVARTSADFVAAFYTPVGTLVKCEHCQLLSVNGAHRADCSMNAVATALAALAQINEAL